MLLLLLCKFSFSVLLVCWYACLLPGNLLHSSGWLQIEKLSQDVLRSWTDCWRTSAWFRYKRVQSSIVPWRFVSTALAKLLNLCLDLNILLASILERTRYNGGQRWTNRKHSFILHIFAGFLETSGQSVGDSWPQAWLSFHQVLGGLPQRFKHLSSWGLGQISSMARVSQSRAET